RRTWPAAARLVATLPRVLETAFALPKEAAGTPRSACDAGGPASPAFFRGSDRLGGTRGRALRSHGELPAAGDRGSRIARRTRIQAHTAHRRANAGGPRPAS